MQRGIIWIWNLEIWEMGEDEDDPWMVLQLHRKQTDFFASSEIRISFRISYCSADATFDHVFAFIATNRDNTMECHAFLCPKVVIIMMDYLSHIDNDDFSITSNI